MILYRDSNEVKLQSNILRHLTVNGLTKKKKKNNLPTRKKRTYIKMKKTHNKMRENQPQQNAKNQPTQNADEKGRKK